MKIKNIIACIALAFAAQAVSAQNNAEKIIRVMVDQMRSHKNVEMVFNYQISPDGKNLGESEKGHAWLQGEAYKIEMTDQQTISDGKSSPTVPTSILGMWTISGRFTSPRRA